MAEQTVLVAIDIGTTKVCVLIGEMAARGGVDVIGIGQAASDGLRKGVVIDIDRTVQSVMAAFEAADRISGLKVPSAFVGISASHISSQNSRGMIAVSGSSRHDVDRGGTARTIEAGRAGAILLRLTPHVARSVKFGYGSAMPMDADRHQLLQLTSSGEETSHGVTRRHIAEIVESRVTEILKFVGAEVEAAGATNRLQAGLVLTGGGSLLDGVTRAARAQLGMSARVVGPRGLGGRTDQIATPPYSAASGLLLWGAHNWASDDARGNGHGPRTPFDGVSSRIGKIFKGLM